MNEHDAVLLNQITLQCEKILRLTVVYLRLS